MVIIAQRQQILKRDMAISVRQKHLNSSEIQFRKCYETTLMQKLFRIDISPEWIVFEKYYTTNILTQYREPGYFVTFDF